MICGVVFLDEETLGGFELFGVRIFVYNDLTDRGETPLFAFRGDGDGIPRSAALVLLPEPPLAIDQVDLLEVQLEPVFSHRHDHVVGLGGASDQSTVGDLLDTVALGAGHGMHFTAKIEVDAMLHHDLPKIRFTPLDSQHAG